MVTSGLIMYFDAANLKCYPGSGPSLHDLSGKGNNGTMVGSATYSNINFGSIFFNGGNGYVKETIINYGTGNYTWSSWIKASTQLSAWIGQGNYPANVAGGLLYGALRNDDGLSNQLTFQVSSGGGGQVILIKSTSNVYTDNVWFNISVTWNSGTQDLLMYVNGASATVSTTVSGTITSLTPSSQTGRFQTIGLYDDSRTLFQFTGNIPLAYIYDRELSASEVLQNYNALKTRFDLT